VDDEPELHPAALNATLIDSAIAAATRPDPVFTGEQ
jgi:hypothetical protein